MKTLLALTLLPLLTFVSAAAELQPAQREALLDDLRKLHRESPNLQADFTERRSSRMLAKPVTSSGTISFQLPNKFRRDIGGSSPSLTVSDGKVLWIYYPNFKEAERYTLGQRAFFDDALSALTAGLNFDEVEKFYNVSAAREGESLELRLTPRRGNLKRVVESMTITLDNDLNIRQTQIRFPKGDTLMTDYRNVRRPSLPASTFTFSPPAGTNVTEPLGKK